eukprot:CAMPEP_0180220156 /NCGR_PEP_ID=MMETSP0987-20121128/18951_1 /TAXON_ID=697907 /ORGANISM="non described non described, Strain CCMP2293" /LENGTH=96 /DNA_ID=CAMNT_0022181007 /DNA_START=833 /DNA_END=1119 /DNA_ORIENTATION=+
MAAVPVGEFSPERSNPSPSAPKTDHPRVRSSSCVISTTVVQWMTDPTHDASSLRRVSFLLNPTARSSTALVRFNMKKKAVIPSSATNGEAMTPSPT